MMVSWTNWLPNTRPVFSLHQLQCVACIIFHSWTHMTTWHEPCRPRTGSTVFWQSAENKKCSLDIADKDRCGPPRSFRVCRHFGGRSFDVVQSDFWFQTQKWKTHISTMITSKFVWLLCHKIDVISIFRAQHLEGAWNFGNSWAQNRVSHLNPGGACSSLWSLTCLPYAIIYFFFVNILLVERPNWGWTKSTTPVLLKDAFRFS